MSRSYYGNLSSKQRRKMRACVARLGRVRSRSDYVLKAIHARRDGQVQVVEIDDERRWWS